MYLILFIAGLVMFVAALPSVLGPALSGVIVRKGHGAVRIDRAVEPERFDKLLRQRMATLIPGAVLIGVALLMYGPLLIALFTAR